MGRTNNTMRGGGEVTRGGEVTGVLYWRCPVPDLCVDAIGEQQLN